MARPNDGGRAGGGISVDEFTRRYPRLYHVAADGSWPSIARHGLLSTSALLDLFEYSEALRQPLERHRRPEYVLIEHPVHGRAWIRDQKPLDDIGLVRALPPDVTPEEWYMLLNRRVFFWPTARRLQTMLNARAYRNRAHTVLTVDTRLLLDRHVDRTTLSPINSGATKPMSHARDRDTFQPLATFPFHERRGRGLDPVAELAIDSSVPDVVELAITVCRMNRNQVLKQLHPSRRLRA